MVKRAKSPEAAEDEKYFTVFQPYPLNANWELEDDYITFCRWIACCIGTEPLHGLLYKPKARGMVLLEIDKRFPDNGLLLGEHRWSDFLQDPSAEEAGRVTQIFHSLYSTGREAQKDGWKRIHVEASWFKDWRPNNPIVKYPYPVTHWCPVPPEDKTNKPLCRPLPIKVKPPPPQVAPPVVGSAGWVETKTGPNPNSPQAQKNAWSKGRPAVRGAAKATPGRQAPATSPTSTWNKPISASDGAPANHPKARAGAWAKGSTALRGPNGSTPAASPISPASNGSPVSPTGVATTPAYPPGLNPKGSPFAPPGLVRKTDSASTLSSGSGVDPYPVKAIEDLFEEHVMISLSPSQDRQLYGLENDESPDPNATVVHPWEQQFVATENLENLWDNVGASEENLWGDEETKKPAVPVILCPVHGIICKKGICKEMSKILREQERAKAALEKQENQKNGKGNNNRRGGGGWRQNPSKPESTEDGASVNDDGFSRVGGRNKGGRKNITGRGRQSRDNSSSVVGSSESGGGAVRMRGNSISSQAESVAAPSEAGWDTASVGPWG